MPPVSSSHEITAFSNNTFLRVTDDLLSGRRTAFLKSKNITFVELQKTTTENINGNIGWFYFSSPEEISKLNKEVKLKKDMAWYNTSTDKWEAITESAKLKTGVKVRITLTIETRKALKFVRIEDRKAAAFEPVAYNSGYEWNQDFAYYQSIRDEGRQIFAEQIPSGTTRISYEMKVSQEGEFISGVAELQCMYKPEITAYGASFSIQTGN